MEKNPPGNMAVYALAWPIAMNAILQQAILLIDTILVGGLGEEALAAMGIATSIAGLILGVLFAFSNGTQILVAQAFGASSNTALKSGFWSGLTIGLFVAIIGIVLIIFFRDAIIARLTDVPTIATMASTYLLISCVFIIGLAVSQNISVYLYATGHPKIPFYSKLCELPFNALISYALIFGAWGLPALGLAGAAIGSAVTVVLRTGFLFLYMKQVKFAYLLRPGWTNNRISSTVSAFLSNALPIAGTFISMHFAFTLCLMLYSQLNVHEFAALTILLIWIRTSGMLVTAWCQAMGIWVGRLLGQDSYALLDPFVKKTWKVALCLGVAIAAIFSVTPLLFDNFYPNLDDKTHNAVRLILPMLIILPLVRSSNVVCGNVLRASGQASYAFKVHVTTQWLFTVPVTALFVLALKVPIIWVFGIIVAEELLKAIPFHLRIASGEWKQRIEI